MTGYGRGEATLGSKQYSAEVRSVNSRYIEVKTHLPRTYLRWEHEVVGLLRKKFSRGRFDVFLQVGNVEGSKPNMNLNQEIVDHYNDLLTNLKTRLKLDDNVALSHLLTNKDIFTTEPDDVENAWSTIAAAITTAMDELEKMSVDEGRVLCDEILGRLDQLDAIAKQIENERQRVIEQNAQKYRERIDRLLENRKVDTDRIEQEIAILSDRADITEEVVRLQTHLNSARKLLNKKGPKGRELDFLSQEIHREINTTGQKSQDTVITDLVIKAKSETEKIREQVQNIE